jgi:hypothetical protein
MQKCNVLMLVCLPDSACANGNNARLVRSPSNIVGGGGVSRITHDRLGVQYPCAMHAGIKIQMLAVVRRFKVGRIPGDAIRPVVNPHTPHRVVLKRECPSGTDALWDGSCLAEVGSAAVSWDVELASDSKGATAKEECGDCMRMWPS